MSEPTSMCGICSKTRPDARALPRGNATCADLDAECSAPQEEGALKEENRGYPFLCACIVTDAQAGGAAGRTHAGLVRSLENRTVGGTTVRVDMLRVLLARVPDDTLARLTPARAGETEVAHIVRTVAAMGDLDDIDTKDENDEWEEVDHELVEAVGEAAFAATDDDTALELKLGKLVVGGRPPPSQSQLATTLRLGHRACSSLAPRRQHEG